MIKKCNRSTWRASEVRALTFEKIFLHISYSGIKPCIPSERLSCIRSPAIDHTNVAIYCLIVSSPNDLLTTMRFMFPVWRSYFLLGLTFLLFVFCVCEKGNSLPSKSRLTSADEVRVMIPSSPSFTTPSGYTPPLSSSSSSSAATTVNHVKDDDSSSLPPITSSTAVYHGIGIGSRVMRGPSWNYDNQDGGEGKLGTVIELRRWKASYNISRLGTNGIAGVRVLWDTDGTINTYRWSALSIEEGGIQDLKVVGWKELTPTMQNIPSKQEELLQNYKNQLASVTIIELLIDIYTQLNGPQWFAKRGWDKSISSVVSARNREIIKESNSIQYIKNRNNPCTDGWEGITCTDGSIIGLDLSNNNLQGTLPLSFYTLVDKGIISLNLAHNPGLRWERYDTKPGNRVPSYPNNHHQPIPNKKKDSVSLSRFSSPLEEFCRYGKHLRYVDLSGTNLYGNLPECFSKLRKLETLALHSNNIEGSIPLSWSQLLPSSMKTTRKTTTAFGSSSRTETIYSSSSSDDEEEKTFLKVLQLHGNPLLSLPIPDTFIEQENMLQSFTLPSHLQHELRILRQQYFFGKENL